MSANVSEETRRSPRINKNQQNNKQQRIARSPSPRAIQHHPSLTATTIANCSIPRSPSFVTREQSRNQEPTDGLWNLLRQRDWEGADYRLRTHPRDAAWTPSSNSNEQRQSSSSSSSSGGTPLHVACRLRCPLPLLQALVRAWPVALWTPDAAGWIPLHVLLVHSSNTEALVAVIRQGGTAAACFVAASTSTRSNNNDNTRNNNQHHQNLSVVGTALHLACRHGVAVPVLRELLLQCPAELLHRKEPCFPADLLWKQMERVARGYRDPHQADQELLQRWNLLMAAAQRRPLTTDETSHSDNDASSLVREPMFTLHEVLDFEYRCTSGSSNNTSFVPVYLRLFPEAARQQWDDGRLPLHTACALWNQTKNNQQPRSSSRHTHHPHNTTTTLNNILQAFPLAASVRDTTGRLPLHILLTLEHNNNNNSTATNQKRTPAPRSTSSLAMFLPQLLAAFPVALETRCPLTGLYPFQLAAAQNDEESTIYALLRASPQVVHRNSSSNNNTEP